MAQPPFQSDLFQIEPAASGTRTLSRASSGGLLFIDPTFVAGLTLAQLAGLQTVTGVLVVGQGGGAQYTSIQDAIDDIPTTSSPLLPYVVLILAGVYTENITISNDGVFLVGLGHVEVISDGVSPTITITEATGLVPTLVGLQNLIVTNAEDEPCIFVDGSNTFASGTITVNNTLAAGDTVTLGGIVLTGVAGARTSGSDNFDASLGTVNALAAEINAALTDEANSFAASVGTSVLGAIVTVTSLVAGAGGNAITLAASTTPGGRISVSGANLAGGGGVDSDVASNEVLILDCTLKATSAAALQISANIVGNVRVMGGTWAGSSATSLALVYQTSSFVVQGVAWTNDFEVAYSTAADEPSGVPSGWALHNVPRVNDVLVNLTGAGDTTLGGCPAVGDVTQGGNRTLRAVGCALGALQLEDTTAASLVNTSRGGLVGVGTPTLAEAILTGTATFVASVAETVAFTVDQPDTNYSIYLDCPELGQIPQVTAKTVADFDIEVTAPLTATVRYTVIRDVT